MRFSLLTAIVLIPYLPLKSQAVTERIQMRLNKDLMFIELKINDSSEPLNFIFDSGAGVTVIDSQVASRLKLQVTGRSNIRTSGKALLSEESSGNSVHIGANTLLDSVDLIWMDLSHVSRFMNQPVHGFIGYDLLAAYIVETNVDALEMRFHPQGYDKPSDDRRAFPLIPLVDPSGLWPYSSGPSPDAAAEPWR